MFLSDSGAFAKNWENQITVWQHSFNLNFSWSCEENYIQIDNARIMREILRWYMKQERQSLEFKKIKASCTTLTELTEKIFGKTV